MAPDVSGPAPALNLARRQTPALNLALRQALLPYLSLLPAAAAQLEDVVTRALNDNPMLTRASGGPCVSCGRHCASGAHCADCSLQRVSDHLTSGPHDWRTELEAEARCELPATLQPLLSAVIGSLDDRGLLPRTGEDPDNLARVLQVLRAIGPPGIAARSPADCVRVQLVALAEIGRLPPWVAELTLPDLAAAVHGDAPDRIRAILPDIVDLVTPHVVFSDVDRTPPPPDVHYHCSTDGGLIVDVMDAAWFGLALDDPAWVAAGRGGRAWLSPYRAEARQLMAALDARANLLGRLAHWLGTVQRGFLFDGDGAHRPLTRVDAAQALGHHPATVGRVVSGKTARCPDGRLVPMAAFFGGRTAVLEELRALATDHPDASDAYLAELLAASGHAVARRTVGKYRTLLGIPPRR